MDAFIAAAARALASGDALGALKRVALREDPPALAMRGIAMAQLGDYPRAGALLRRAASTFGRREELARARCALAGAEVGLAMRDLTGSFRAFQSIAKTLEAHGDLVNSQHAYLVDARRLLLMGRVGAAATALARLNLQCLPPSLATVAELAHAEVALRSLHTAAAREALNRAAVAAQRARIPALLAEVAVAVASLDDYAARSVHAGTESLLRLDDIEALLYSDALVVDACRRGIRFGRGWRSMARKPVLFKLLRMLAAAFPSDVPRSDLIASAFRLHRPDETHRVRLRVEMGRLRAFLSSFAGVEVSPRGYVLVPWEGRNVFLLIPPMDGGHASLLALLGDGAAWSTSSLALALDCSQRTIQRALLELEAGGRVRSMGQGRAKLWLGSPLIGFTTVLLLPMTLAPQ